MARIPTCGTTHNPAVAIAWFATRRSPFTLPFEDKTAGDGLAFAAAILGTRLFPRQKPEFVFSWERSRFQVLTSTNLPNAAPYGKYEINRSDQVPLIEHATDAPLALSEGRYRLGEQWIW